MEVEQLTYLKSHGSKSVNILDPREAQRVHATCLTLLSYLLQDGRPGCKTLAANLPQYGDVGHSCRRDSVWWQGLSQVESSASTIRLRSPGNRHAHSLVFWRHFSGCKPRSRLQVRIERGWWWWWWWWLWLAV